MNEWDEWKTRQLEKLYPPKPPKEPGKPREPTPRRQITARELHKLQRLQQVSFGTGWNGAKRFVREMADANADTQITEGQARYIEILWYKYRRQLGHNDPKPAGYIGRNDL